MTKTADGNPAQPDIMPPPLDDQVEPAAAAAVAEVERSEQADEAPRVPPQVEGPYDETRNRIADLYRQQRDRDDAEAAAALADQQAAREAAEAADAAGQHQQGQQHVKIVVDGREQILPLSEVIKRAQINSAGDARLEETKKLLREAKALHRGEDPDFEEHEEQPRHSTPTPGNQNDRLKAIVEKIQIGDSDEGVEALQELTRVVHQGIQQQAFVSANEAAMKNALDRFVQKYPDVAKDADLGNTGMSVLARVLKSELGRVPGVTQGQLDEIPVDMHAVRAMAHSVAAMRQQGHQLRNFDQIMDAVGDQMSRKFGLRPGSVVRGDRRIGTQAEIDARLERKRSMPWQPRPAGIRSAPEPEYRRPKTAAEIVAEARRARGFDR
jgi:hypothetical protein